MDYYERLYILYLFQLAFSRDEQQQEVYAKVINWEETVRKFQIEPEQEAINWRTFQQEYRDYICSSLSPASGPLSEPMPITTCWTD